MVHEATQAARIEYEVKVDSFYSSSFYIATTITYTYLILLPQTADKQRHAKPKEQTSDSQGRK